MSGHVGWCIYRDVIPKAFVFVSSILLHINRKLRENEFETKIAAGIQTSFMMNFGEKCKLKTAKQGSVRGII